MSKGKKSSSDLKIMEWRFNQFLGEKLTQDQIKSYPENESFLLTDVKFQQMEKMWQYQTKEEE